MKTADKNIRFGDDIIYRDLDASMTFTTQDKYLGYIVSSAPTTGKTGTFTQNSIGSPEYSFFADALEGAKAGYIVLTSNPW
jgi:hypothetical protein